MSRELPRHFFFFLMELIVSCQLGGYDWDMTGLRRYRCLHVNKFHTWSALSPSWLAFVYCISFSLQSRLLLLLEKRLSITTARISQPCPALQVQKEALESFYYFLGRTLIGPAWGMYPPALPEWVFGKGQGAGWKQSSVEGEFVCL